MIPNWTIYKWRKGGVTHFLETVVGEDGKTLTSWRFWVSLEPEA